uniref:Uncharacterized protein n=1 Tax=Clostridium novyi B str. ATCC 27606 TaxID=1443123 RepID=A0AA40M1R8_CLONO|nr:hypothetical protein Z958_p0171 [Clostridium novyi B str. NCTC 9691]KEI11391.1 hypothetical protein Z959_p0091 [Clostridium novyi B str. ATCC 27606]
MFTKVVGSSPTLPILISISIYALTQVGQGVVKATITNLINSVKDKYKRKWFVINFIFMIIALCCICRELAQLVEHVIK